jgi:hypothetical protein
MIAVPASLRGANATKQSILCSVSLDCFASLAMTGNVFAKIQNAKTPVRDNPAPAF